MSKTKLAQENISIILGKTDYEIVELKIEWERDYFSITHTSYDYAAFTSEEGEQRARDYLDDDSNELWKSAVENNQTELGLDDWNEQILNNEGWETILGDIKEISINDQWYYLSWSSCGAGMDCLNRLEKTRLSYDEIQILKQGEKKLHLKKLKEISENPRLSKLLDKVKNIFLKYEIKDEDTEIGQYTNIGEDMNLGENKNE